MRKTFSRIALAAAAVLLLGSCSRINERIDKLEGRIEGIEKESIATINNQIESINSSIADLGAIRSNIQELKSKTESQAGQIGELQDADTQLGKKIEALESADEAIGERIDNLQKYVNDTLKSYATTEWVNATFSTLAQYEATCDTIAKIDARIGSMDTRLSKSIEDCADSLKSWVNVQLDGYYTAAEMDAKVAEMKAQIDTLSGESATAADSLKAEIAATKAEIDTVKANIRAEYKSAIETAITELDGKLNNKLQTQIINVTSQIYSLEPKITELENKISALKTRIDALESMIQSVTIIPAYIDGSVEGFGSILKIKCVVEPADAVAEITKDDIIVLISEAITKAVKFDTVAVSKLELDKTTGEINIKADISSIPPVPDGKTLMAALEITIGPSNYITGFYPVYSGANVSVTKTEDGSPKIGISSDPDFEDVVISGEIPVESFFEESKSTTIEVEGFGTITFDETAAAKIKENANGATNILIKVEDITNTLANPVQDADVVLEVTMKAVDEAGTPVFPEGNAAGAVTLSIPLDEDVVFVKTVTLVDDDGEPIDGGVIPESIQLDKINHILSFKVEHFSKYAVGYVKSKDFKAVTGVILDSTSLTLAVGGSKTLTATVAPDNATNKNVTWSSSDTTKVKVDKNGKVTAKAAGTANIIVTTDDVVTATNKPASDTCIVTVVVPVTGVTLNENTMALAVDSTKTLIATVAPENATNQEVTWASSNTAVATVDKDGKVTGISDGTATITVTTNDGSKTATCAVTVTVFVPVTGVNLNNTTMTLAVDSTKTLIATIAPDDATNKKVTWSSSNTDVATVGDDGKVAAVAAGTATITVTTEDGSKTAICVVTVVVPVTEVSLDSTSLTLAVGRTETLTATIAPDNATNKNVTWSSSNTAVATVDKDGKVTAVAAGNATITVTTEDGSKTATCGVTVVVPVTGVSLNKTSMTLPVGGTETLTATVAPDNATNNNVTWSSSNTDVATVGDDGKVTAVAHGTATITVTTEDGSKTATCAVTVTTGTGFGEYGEGGNI